MSVNKYKIDVPELPAAEIDPQGEYTFRNPQTGAGALLAPTREGDALVPLLGGFALSEIAALRGQLAIVLALGRDEQGRLTDGGVPIGGAPAPAPVITVLTDPTLPVIHAGQRPSDLVIDLGTASVEPDDGVAPVSYLELRRGETSFETEPPWDSGTAAAGEIVFARTRWEITNAVTVYSVVVTALVEAALPAIETSTEGVTTVSGDFDALVIDATNDDYDGTFPVTEADFAGGRAVNLIPPKILYSGGPDVILDGTVFTRQAGLWAWYASASPVISGQWHRDGVPIAGATAETYAKTAADDGAGLQWIEAEGDRIAASPIVRIPEFSLYPFIGPAQTVDLVTGVRRDFFNGFAYDAEAHALVVPTLTGTLRVDIFVPTERAPAGPATYTIEGTLDSPDALTLTIRARNGSFTVHATAGIAVSGTGLRTFTGSFTLPDLTDARAPDLSITGTRTGALTISRLVVTAA